jgi:hypothetical protein
VSWRQPATSFLHELVALDLPDSPATVTTEHTDRWGVSSTEVFAAGRENIAAHNDPVSSTGPSNAAHHRAAQ